MSSQNKEALMQYIAGRMAIAMDEMEVTERLRVHNTNIDTNHLLFCMKQELAQAIADLYFNSLLQRNAPASTVSMVIAGQTLMFGSSSMDSQVLGKMFRLLAKLETYPFVEIELDFGLRTSILAPILQGLDQSLLMGQLPQVRYDCLFALKQGQNLHLCTLSAKNGAPVLQEVVPSDDLTLSGNVGRWSSGNLIMSVQYPKTIDQTSRDRILATLEHICKQDSWSPASIRDEEDECEDHYEISLHINASLQRHEIEKEVAMLRQLAKELQEAGGKMFFHCHYRADESRYAILQLEGTEQGINARTAVLD